MSNKSRSKVQKIEEDNEEYHHPKLEEQIVVRFPAAVAQTINQKMDEYKDDKSEAEIFNIKFTNKNTACVTVDKETFQGTLLNLPTIVETHRTVDGSHLFKSADIGEILIVQRTKDPQPNVDKETNTFQSGITPPTSTIIESRKAKQQNARTNSESDSIKGIDYWEMVEIQLAALLAKDKNARPVTRHEFFEEPEIDPVKLEKCLRRKYGDDFKGYSGRPIDESELDKAADSEPVIQIPAEIMERINPQSLTDKDSEKEEEDEEESNDEPEDDEEEEESGKEEPVKEEEEAPEAQEPPSQDQPTQQSSSSGEYEEEEEEEEKQQDNTEEIKKKIIALENKIKDNEKKIKETQNLILKKVLHQRNAENANEIEKLKKQLNA